MRITSKGQVTIPAEIREQAGLLPHTEVKFEFDGKAVRIVRANTVARMAGVQGLSRTCEDVETSL
jgi:AbrB family looped-hinge helix DNA binding protein